MCVFSPLYILRLFKILPRVCGDNSYFTFVYKMYIILSIYSFQFIPSIHCFYVNIEEIFLFLGKTGRQTDDTYHKTNTKNTLLFYFHSILNVETLFVEMFKCFRSKDRLQIVVLALKF